jgi:hypothetical protein
VSVGHKPGASGGEGWSRSVRGVLAAAYWASVPVGVTAVAAAEVAEAAGMGDGGGEAAAGDDVHGGEEDGVVDGEGAGEAGGEGHGAAVRWGRMRGSSQRGVCGQNFLPQHCSAQSGHDVANVPDNFLRTALPTASDFQVGI